MNNTANTILNQTLELNSNERATVAESLLLSLDRPDPKIDKIWAKESDDRVEAFNKGLIKKISQEKVFAKYR